ncbi:MAG TPA: o-succinylbenzoate synthase [Propionibacteriaceae bacterium]|nr:o-succinylbenzoate synthase [Propionibacteriaceae bacterium]
MGQTWTVLDEPRCYTLGLRTRFRGLGERQGMVWRGAAGWAEWSPFLDYQEAQLVPWLHAAQEAAEHGWPEPLRAEIPVNSTIPAVDPERAYDIARTAGCRTAKIKVAERGQMPTEDAARVEAVRDALGPSGKVRIDANGGWSLDEALNAIRELNRFDLEYVEQPCASVDELADLRRRLARSGLSVPVAADESIRRAQDPYQVAERQAADIAVLKVQPLGGVRACLQIAERIGLPVVVSSALETSIGIRAGLALAAALPELPYACGLNTVALLADVLATEPLIAVDGVIKLGDLTVDRAALDRHRPDDQVQQFWQARLVQTRRLASG